MFSPVDAQADMSRGDEMVLAKQSSPMSVVGGERLVFQSTEVSLLSNCGRSGAVAADAEADVERQAAGGQMQQMTGIMLTDKRIVYHWVKKVGFCLPSTKVEESFSYSDVQFVWLQRGYSYIFLFLGACALIAGAFLAATAKKDNMLMGAGIGCIIAGILLIAIWILQLYSKGVWLNVSFSRPNVSILDWNALFSVGATRTSRSIQLTPAHAHVANYTLLSHPLVYNAKPHGNLKYL